MGEPTARSTVVTPTGTRLPQQGIDLMLLFAFSKVVIPSEIPSVHWDYLGMNDTGRRLKWRVSTSPG